MEKQLTICPFCKGCGKIIAPRNNTPNVSKEEQVAIATALRNEGYTIREIMSIMGFKHPGSISHLLTDNTKQE